MGYNDAMKKLMTLCIPHKHPKVLLGMKKKGFGAGKWNGFGGKVESGESVDVATKRELEEEAGVSVEDIQKIGIVSFTFEGEEDCYEVHIYKAKEVLGEPKESEEMMPKWFFVDEVPFMEMWSGDRLWWPLFMKDRKFKGAIHFDKNDQVLEYKIEEVEAL